MPSSRLDAAIQRFDKAVRAATMAGSQPKEDWPLLTAEYDEARLHLREVIDDLTKQSYAAGEQSGFSRSQTRPGYGEMGG